MKLRNKKTGEIINSEDLFTDEFIIDLFNKSFSHFDSKLNEIQKEWEVYEEKKKVYWFIGWSGEVDLETDDDFEVDNNCKEIGNYFATKKEAKKAVKKLKAWKRLKDKGFRFNNWDLDADDEDVNVLLSSDAYKGNKVYDFAKDLDLLFGGEDE